MALYQIYGKWYHLSYSDYFKHVVRARSPRAALLKAARSLSDVEKASEVDWEGGEPTKITVGQLDPQPRFWVGGDQMFQIRSITQVTPVQAECPTCKGTGKALEYVAAT